MKSPISAENRAFREAAPSRYTFSALVMGVVIIYATFIILFNLLSDLAYHLEGAGEARRSAFRSCC